MKYLLSARSTTFAVAGFALLVLGGCSDDSEHYAHSSTDSSAIDDLAQKMISRDTPKTEYDEISNQFSKLSVAEKYDAIYRASEILIESMPSDELASERSAAEMKTNEDYFNRVKEYSVNMNVFLPEAGEEAIDSAMNAISSQQASNRAGCTVIKSYPKRVYYRSSGRGYDLNRIGRASNGGDFFCDYELQFGRKISNLYSYTWAAHYFLNGYTPGSIIASSDKKNILVGFNRTKVFWPAWTEWFLKYSIEGK